MTSEELTKFFAACNPEQRRIFSTMLLTGGSPGAYSLSHQANPAFTIS